MDDGEYESDFEDESTVRSSPTKSITLPYSSTHRCFTQSNGYYSARKTPSSVRSENPGEKYLKSSFPDLLGHLGNFTKPSKALNHEDNTEQKKEASTKLTFGEEIRKRNEYQWLRIEDVVKDTMEKYDEYCKNLVIKNELQQKEIQEKNKQQKMSLQKMEEKKREEHIKQSSYARIWNHHAKMRELAEKLYQEKVEKEQTKRAKRMQKKVDEESYDIQLRHWKQET